MESDCQDPKSDCHINFKGGHPIHAIRIDTSSIMEMDRGSIEVGKLADIQIWDLPTFEDEMYASALMRQSSN